GSTRRRESRWSARARWIGPNAPLVATSKLSSTRESAVFTLWPPGPDEWLNRHRSSPSGITIERLTRSGPIAAVSRRDRVNPVRWSDARSRSGRGDAAGQDPLVRARDHEAGLRRLPGGR